MIKACMSVGLFLFVSTSFAATDVLTTPSNPANDKDSFSIEYSPNSKIKDIPLKSATLKVKVFYNGNPNGLQDIATDENQHFTLTEYKDTTSLALEIVSIEGQEKFNAVCKGSNLPGHTDILITCRSKT